MKRILPIAAYLVLAVLLSGCGGSHAASQAPGPAAPRPPFLPPPPLHPGSSFWHQPGLRCTFRPDPTAPGAILKTCLLK